MITAQRRGSILVVVVGMVGIIAAICLTFLAKARIEAHDMVAFSRMAQARIALAAACAYVQETSRIGWDDPATPQHEEAFGWVDVRDGQAGPRTELVTPASYTGSGALNAPAVYRDVVPPTATDAAGRPLWPRVGAISRHPFYRWTRPPYAISPDAAPNAIENDPTKPLFGLALMRKPDPQPAVTTAYADFAAGDPRLVPGTAGRGWFRLFRDGPATFVITVGSGATQGFKTWSEVEALGQNSAFVGGEAAFEALRSEEVRLWYRIEWSPGISVFIDGSTPTQGQFDRSVFVDHHDWYTHIRTSRGEILTSIVKPWSTSANQAGTIQWIQRLRAPPEVW